MHVALKMTNSSRRDAWQPVAATVRERFFALVPTAWGNCAVAWSRLAPAPSFSVSLSDDVAPMVDAQLTRILTPGLGVAEMQGAMRAAHPSAVEVFPSAHHQFHPETVPLWFPQLVGYLQNFFDNTLRHPHESAFVDVWNQWRHRLDLSPLTPFQQTVLHVVSRIPRGECLTYGQVAREAGKPNAARAVGGALARNPFPVLIPCHRVIGASGAMTGFTAPGGVKSKKRMLELEGV